MQELSEQSRRNRSSRREEGLLPQQQLQQQQQRRGSRFLLKQLSSSQVFCSHVPRLLALIASCCFCCLLLLLLAGAPAAQAVVPRGTQIEHTLACTVCRIIIGSLDSDLQYLVSGGKYWRQADLDLRLSIACGHPHISVGDMHTACTRFMLQHSRTIKHDVYKRYTPGFEEYEELLPAKEYCITLKACRPGDLTLHETYKKAAEKMIGESEERKQIGQKVQDQATKQRLFLA